MSEIRTCYSVLKVSRDAPEAVIRAAYKALMQKYHPDKFGGSEEEALRISKIIQQSYSVLIDPVKRAEHDAWIAEQEYLAAREKESKQNTEATESYCYENEEPNQKSEVNSGPPRPPKEPEQPVSGPKEPKPVTHPWRRLFARCMDYFIWSWPVNLILVPWMIQEQMISSTAMKNTAAYYFLIQIIGTASWAVVEPVVLSLFGNTLGKTLFGLRLSTKDTSASYVARSISVWCIGMGFGLPIVSGFANLVSYIRLAIKGQTDWDNLTGFTVEADRITWIRQVFCGIAVCGMFIFFISGAMIRNGVITSPPVNMQDRSNTASVPDESAVELPSAHSPNIPSSPGQSEAELRKAHFDAIFAAHPDIDEIVNDPKFSAWIYAQTENARSNYLRIVEKGTADEVISMLSHYKANLASTTNKARLKSDRTTYVAPKHNNDGGVHDNELCNTIEENLRETWNTYVHCSQGFQLACITALNAQEDRLRENCSRHYNNWLAYKDAEQNRMRKTACDIKAVMTDEEIENCKSSRR